MAGIWLTNVNKFIKSVPVCSWIDTGVNSMAVATARVVNAAGIITVIMLNLYAFIMVPRRDLFRIIRTLLLEFIIWI